MNALAEYISKNSLAKAGELSVKCNSFTEPFGLSITCEQALEITKMRYESLERNGRVEFGEGITEKLIIAFRDSPYIYQEIYVPLIEELQELFYYFKNECRDILSDDELLYAMALVFNGRACGSTELLSGLSGDEMIEVYRTKGILPQMEENEDSD